MSTSTAAEDKLKLEMEKLELEKQKLEAEVSIYIWFNWSARLFGNYDLRCIKFPILDFYVIQKIF